MLAHIFSKQDFIKKLGWDLRFRMRMNEISYKVWSGQNSPKSDKTL